MRTSRRTSRLVGHGEASREQTKARARVVEVFDGCLAVFAACALLFLASPAVARLHSCEAVFDPSVSLMEELVDMRTSAHEAQTRGEDALARTLYGRFQSLVREARGSGIETDRLAELIDPSRNVKSAAEREAEARIAKAEEGDLGLFDFQHFMYGFKDPYGSQAPVFSQDGSLLITRHGSVLAIRDAATGDLIQEIVPRYEDWQSFSDPHDVAISPNRKLLAVGTKYWSSTALGIYDLEARKLISLTEPRKVSRSEGYSSLKIDDEGRVSYVTASQDSLLYHDAELGDFALAKTEFFDWWVRGEPSPDRSRFVAVTTNHNASFFEIPKKAFRLGRLVTPKLKPMPLETATRFYHFVFDPSGKRLAAIETDGPIKIWNLEDGRLVGKIDAPADFFSSLTYLGDGAELIAGRKDGAFNRYDASTLEILGTTEGSVLQQSRRTEQVISNPDGSLLVTIHDGDMKVWSKRPRK